MKQPTDLLQFLPAHLREAASKLPPEQQHTVLELPDAGEGHNSGLLSVATTCYWMGVSADDTLAHLRDIYDQDRTDYRTAPARAVNRVWEYDGAVPIDNDGELAAPREELLLRFRRTPISEFVELSPIKDAGTMAPIDVIKGMFDADDIINIQFTGREAGTLMKVSDLPADLDPYKFLNPSTFKKVGGIDVKQPDGSMKRMTRCNANVKHRPYMLLECDYKLDDPDGPAKVERFNSVILAMAKFIPLIMVMDSGGKSIHALFAIGDTPPKTVATFFSLAVMYGADKQMAVRSQIARMPNVSSAGAGRGPQTVLYFDPDQTAVPDGIKGKPWELAPFEKYLLDAQQLVFYYSGKGTYYMQSNTERWITINRFSLTKQLAVRGFREQKTDVELVSPVEEIITSIETDKAIEAALTGASGKHAGYYEDNGFNYLVLKSPVLLKPRQGDWSAIRNFLTHALRSDPTQLGILNGMLSSSIKDFRNGGKRESRISPCQAMHIAGDNDSGKSFLNKFILPALFGGRWANAESYFSPKSGEHNSEMFMSDLLILDDTSVLGTTHRERKIMTEKIKEITVGSGQGYRGMFQDRITSRPWWRIFRMLNTTPDDLATLPLMEKGAEDKWILLHFLTMDGGPVDKTAKNWFEPWKDLIVSQIPAYLYYLLHEHKIGPEAKDPSGRYAVKSYKNSTLMESLSEDSLETYLIHRIDNEAHSQLFSDDFGDAGTSPWRGTSGQLYDLLCEVGSFSSQKRFSKTCPSPRVLSSQLKLLEKAFPQRFVYSNREGVTPKKLDGNFYWIVAPRGESEVGEEDCF